MKRAALWVGVLIAAGLILVALHEILGDTPEGQLPHDADPAERPADPAPVPPPTVDEPPAQADQPKSNPPAPEPGPRREPSAASRAPVKPALPPKPRWVVRGRIADLPADAARPFRVEVTAIHVRKRPGPATVFEGGEAGRFEADVTALVRREPPPEELEVVVNHPAFIPRVQRVKLVDGRKEGEALTVWTVEVRLVRAASVSGVVRDAGGKSLPGVEVALYRMKAGQPVKPHVRMTRTDVDGRFVLQSSRTTPSLIVADDPERQPVCAPAEPTVGAVGAGVDLILSDGVAITGRVLRSGRPPRLGEYVFAVAPEATPRPAVLSWRRGQSLVYRGGRVVRHASYVRSGEEGRYRLSGLAPGPYRVRLTERPFGGGGDDVVHRREVQAPASGVDFELVAGVPHVFTVLAGGMPLPRAKLRFSGVRYGQVLIGPSQRVTLDLPPGKVYRIRASHQGCVTRLIDLVTRESIEPVQVPIRLELDPESARLMATVSVANGSSLEKVHCWFERGEGRGRRIFWRVVPVREGRFEVGGIPPATYRIRIRAGEHRRAGGYLMAAERVVEFPARASVEAHFALKLGGRIRLAVRDRDGRLLSKSCRVRDAAGQELKLWFAARGGMGAGTGSTSLRAPAETDPPLAPGRYRVEFVRGRHREVVKAFPVQVRAGHTTDVEWVVDE